MVDPGSEKEKSQTKEIDIFELLQLTGTGIRKFFVFLFKSLVFLFLFFIRRFYLFLVFALIGAGIGYLVSSNTNKHFSSEMIVQPNGFTSVDMVYYINDIHDMCTKKNHLGISSAFNIDIEIAKKLKDLKAFHYIDVNNDLIGDFVDYHQKFNPRDTTTRIVNDRLLIRAEVYDNNFFHEIKEGIIHYINKNIYLITVNQLRKQELDALIEQSEHEIDLLDSIQRYEYINSYSEGLGLDQSGQIIFLNEKETKLYYQDKIYLLYRRLQYEKSLELATQPITIIKDFSEMVKEENSLSEYLILTAFLTMVSGYLIMLVFVYWKPIKKYLLQFE